MHRSRTGTALLAAAVVVLVAGCDQDYPSGAWDTSVDLGVDPGTDTIVEVVEEPVEEPVDEPVDEPEPCEYPVGPYGFDRVGDIAGPATWPACIKAAGETYPSALANLADFQCDPEVQSIGVFFATQS